MRRVIATEHHTQQRMPAMFEAPRPHVMRNGAAFLGIETHIPAFLLGIRGVKDDARQAMRPRHARPQHARPVATAHAHVP